MRIMLEAARVNSGYTQRDAAKLLGICCKMLARYEEDSSYMPYEIIQKIPQVYGVDVDQIFFGNKNEFIRFMREKASEFKRVVGRDQVEGA